ncbi:MAG: hypothetical protein HXY41_08840 [Chloroflexi bacterium]|nr:hypothetical protein [Chloroflexota bacterium]
MQLSHIVIFAAGGLIFAGFCPSRLRGWLLMAASVVALYWLQPTLTIFYLDFALPTITLTLAVALWWLTRPPETPALDGDDRLALALLAGLVLALSATRYLAPELRPTASRAPDVPPVALALLLLGLAGWLISRAIRARHGRLTAALIALVGLFIILKTPPLASGLAAALRGLTGQNQALAAPLDLEWLGFSYIAFRFIHTVRERQMGKLPALSLREYVTYIIFFPAITAGPIDRAERFIKDDRALLPAGENPAARLLTAPRLAEAGGRIGMGLFKKFVIADSLALLALSAANAGQAQSAGALWLLLYAYAFRLFFDFSGYTDIAIGLGILLGFKLPENFDRPYLKNNLAAFWQSWHITLSNWARFYVFSPLSRALLKRKVKAQSAVFIAQMATMLIIGLWHGVSGGFIVWGIWHGLGLFVHKWWSDRTRKWYLSLNQKPRLKTAWTAAGVFITFQFVTLGWVWFALPLESAWPVFWKLFGMTP